MTDVQGTEPAPLDEIVRIPSPAPVPQPLAHDGESLRLGSFETGFVYGIDPKQGRVFEEMVSPGKPIGAACAGDEPRFVVRENGASGDREIVAFAIPS